MHNVSGPKRCCGKRALACDACRKSKRKCDGQEPCKLCIKHGRQCTYSVDHRVTRNDHIMEIKRPRQTHVMKAAGPVQDKDTKEKVYSFYVRAPGSYPTQMSDHEAANILGKLYGSAPVYHPCAGYPDHTQPCEKQILEIRGLGYNMSLSIDRPKADMYMARLREKKFVNSALFQVSELETIYVNAFESKSNISSGGYLLLYAALGIASMDSSFMPSDRVSSFTRDLFTASSSLVGSAMVDCTFASALGLRAFGQICIETGEILSHGRLCSAALDILVSLGFHRTTPVPHDEAKTRLFWDLYTWSHFYSVIIGGSGEPVTLDQINVPEPTPSGPEDRDYDFLHLRILILKSGFYNKHGVRMSNGPEFLAPHVKKIQKTARELLGGIDLVKNTYHIMLSSILLHYNLYAFKTLQQREEEDLEAFSATTCNYIDVVWSAIEIMGQTQVAFLWHVSQDLFLCALQIIYAMKIMKRETVTKELDYLYRITALLERMKMANPQASKWSELVIKVQNFQPHYETERRDGYPDLKTFFGKFLNSQIFDKDEWILNKL